ncbi:hypothetical protein AOQ84DRAFT_379689 [Glonium stellatum]|uniref:Nephrocystin 3-like N-terminal domain-containing protein n=1 Tax=Glonium stellatum TaxID=574774 RepID=A0A8E2EUY5_9PEZI|nr:hypothetical protein AOQ84DRAFT_379689 [Glonium stellatum]
MIHNQKSDLLLALHALQIDATSVTIDGMNDLNQIITQLSQEVAQSNNMLRFLIGSVRSTHHSIINKHERREPGTGNWFLESQEFRTWGTSGSLLWINGNVGCGKPVLCSAIIENVREHCATQSGYMLAYFYFSFADIQKHTALVRFSSLIHQLCQNRVIPASILQLYDQCIKNQNTRPILGAVKAALKPVVEEID